MEQAYGTERVLTCVPLPSHDSYRPAAATALASVHPPLGLVRFASTRIGLASKRSLASVHPPLGLVRHGPDRTSNELPTYGN